MTATERTSVGAERADVDAAIEVDVVVIGHGPVGSVLAILLAQFGHRVTVLERWPEPYPLPRAVHFDDDVARILQACGIGAELAEISEPADLYEWRNAAGLPLARFGRSGLGPSGWPSSSMFHQPTLEGRLADRARTLPTLSIRRGVEAVGISQDVDGVTIHARDHARDRDRDRDRDADAVEVRCRYAIGCDGANSTVRRLLGIPTVDLGFRHDWLIVDVVLDEPRIYDPINVQMCDPARPTTAVSGGPGRRRWEFMRRPDETLDSLVGLDTAWHLLAPWDVTPDNATIERHAVYTFGAGHAVDWRMGRVLLAGDAAHLMPPFAGEGMCSGIRDVANLAWKLDLVLAGRGGDHLLDSYTEERLPHARAVTELSIELGSIICVPDPDAAAARDEMMRAGFTETPTEIPPMPALVGALLPVGDPGAGQTFPQGMIVSDGVRVRFDDVHGAGWRLVTITGEHVPADVDPALVSWFADLPGIVVTLSADTDADRTYASWFAEHNCTWALQRPDFHVHGVARDAAGAAELLADLRHRLTTPPGSAVADPGPTPIS